MDSRLLIVPLLALAVAIVWQLRTVFRERAGLRVSGECISVPGCTVLVVKAVKVGMTPVHLQHMGVIWGHLAWKSRFGRVPWAPQALVVNSIYPTPRQVTINPGIDMSQVAFKREPPPVAKGFLDRFKENSVRIASLENPNRPKLTFDGEVHSEEFPMKLLAPYVKELGRPRAVVVATANGRYFYGPLTDEVWDGLRTVADAADPPVMRSPRDEDETRHLLAERPPGWEHLLLAGPRWFRNSSVMKTDTATMKRNTYAPPVSRLPPQTFPRTCEGRSATS